MKRIVLLAFLLLATLAYAQWGAVLAGSTPTGSSPVTFTDLFDRADENPLSDGGAWTNGITGVSNMQILSTFAASANGSQGRAFVGTPSFAANPDQQATIELQSVQSVAACTRVASNGDSYQAYLASSTSIQIYKVVSGVSNTVGAAYTVTTLVAGDTVTLRSVGSTHTLYINGVLQTSGGASRTDSSLTTGSPGIQSDSTTGLINAFTCTSI